MEFSDFLKKDFYDFSSSPFAKTEEGSVLETVAQSFAGRKDAVKELLQLLTSDKIKLIHIKGPSGTGKTYFVKSILYLLEKKVLTYYFECSQATNIDDIILSLFNYLKKTTAKDREYIKNFKISASYSIDERLINRIKNLQKPLLIFIEDIENLFQATGKNNRAELISFLNFLSSVPVIKVIATGEYLPDMEDKKGVCTLKIGGLRQQEAYKLIEKAEVSDSEGLTQSIFEITGGNPENILLFCAFVKNSKLPANELVQRVQTSGGNFKKLVAEQVYDYIPQEYKDLADFLILSRHSFSLEALKKLDFIPDTEEKINYLLSTKLLSESNSNFQIKPVLKNYLIPKISKDQKVKIHNRLHDMYSDQIAAKLEQRILPVSRKLLYSEQYFHYVKLSELGVIPEYDAKTRRQMEAEDFLARVEEDEGPDSMDEKLHGELDSVSDEDYDSQISLSEDEKVLVEDAEKEKTSEDNGNVEKTDFDLLQKAGEELKQSLESFQEQDDRLNYNAVLFKLANLYKEHYRHDQALQNYYAILNSEQQYIPDGILHEVLENIGEIYDYRKDFASSINYFTKALLEAQELGNKTKKAEIYFKIALAFDDLGDYESALKFYRQNIETSDNPAENQFLAAACSNTADIYDEMDNPLKAIEFYKKSFDYDKRVNNPEGEYEVLSRLGNIYFETGNYTEAGKCFYKELSIAKEIKDPYKIAMSYIDIGDIFLFEKNYEKAIKAFMLAKKSINTTISTDSKEKINRRFRQVIDEVGRKKYNDLLQKIRAKHA